MHRTRVVKPRLLWRIGALLTVLFSGSLQAAEVSASLGEFLQAGDLAGAQKMLQDELTQDAQNHQARFAQGVVQFLSALEHLGQDQYRYGSWGGRIRSLPIFRFPVPNNPQPETVTYEQVRQMLIDFQNRLLEAEAELARVDVNTEIKLPLNLLTIRLDLDGNGVATEKESFATILSSINRQRPGAQTPDFRVKLDAGDVPWLRGYCHFLCGVCDMVLAYDQQRMFDLAGQWIYPRHVPSQPVVGEPLDLEETDTDRQFLDAIAAVHLASFPVKEPLRMASARQHFLAMIRTSRESWSFILAETDNDREWVPNPKQTGILQMPVSQEQIDSWHGVLTEMEAVLEGTKLIPYWRDYTRVFGPSRSIPEEGRGVNLKKLFEEPKDFDLILFLQGHGALPFVERGKLSGPNTWENLTRTFEGRFFGFAIWFN